VSSYLTFSPLPDPKVVGGVFSVALSVALRIEMLARPGVTWQPAHGARTFLDGNKSIATTRPETRTLNVNHRVHGRDASGINQYSARRRENTASTTLAGDVLERRGDAVVTARI
jgi:hypothetical protein